MTVLLAAVAALALAAAAPATGRIEGSPFPICSGGLNSSASFPLAVFDTSGASPDDLFTVGVLQGTLSKNSPRVAHYARGSGSAYELWINESLALWPSLAPLNLFPDVSELVRAFRASFVAYVLVDLTDNSTLWGTMAAATYRHGGLLAVTAANEGAATTNGLPLLLDVRGWSYDRALAAFNASADFAAFSRDVTTIQTASKSECCMSDYSVFAGALQWWADDAASPAAADILRTFRDGFMLLGWGPDEFHTVAAVSAAGGGVVASDWASNIDFLSNFDLPGLAQKPAATLTAPAAAAVHTACFLATDGDNLQWILGGMPTDSKFWASPDRGAVNLGWTLSAPLVELGPVAMNYLYETASAGPKRDYFVAAVSGAGYLYPDLAANMSSVATRTAAYMQRASMRILNVLASSSDVTPAAAGAYLAQDSIDALFWYPLKDYSGLRGDISFLNGKPIIGGRFNLWGDGSSPSGPTFKNVTGAVEALLALPRDPSLPASYSLIPLHVWSHNVSDARAVQDMLAARAQGAVEIVPPDVFVARIVANLRR